MEFKDYIITEEISILDAMAAINNNSRGVAYICEDRVLKGVVTDGNIRRHILNNGNLDAPISKVANFEPKFVRQKDASNATNYMKEVGVTSVPVLNSKNEITAIKFLYANDEIYKTTNLNTPVIIMAGGKGSRLQPYTQVLPKPLIPIGDKTITEIIMDKFGEFGCKAFNLIVNYKKNLIKTFFLESERAQQVTFTDELEFMGTGGGLKLLENQYKETFFMTNCDVLIEENYSEILNYHKEHNNIITMVCASKATTIPYGTIELTASGKVACLNEKPTFSFMANTGFYVIEPEFLDYIPEKTFIHITDVIEKCIQAGENVGMYPISESAWLDMGQFSEMEKMKEYLEKRK